jgi:hypothetical protein
MWFLKNNIKIKLLEQPWFINWYQKNGMKCWITLYFIPYFLFKVELSLRQLDQSVKNLMLKETWIHKDAFGAPKDVVHLHLLHPTPQKKFKSIKKWPNTCIGNEGGKCSMIVIKTI